MTEPEKFDPYAVLEKYSGVPVNRQASREELKKIFQAAAALAHPDRSGGSTEAMTDVNMAWKILSDPEMRSNFDKGLGPDELNLTQQAVALMTQMLAPIIRTQVMGGVRDDVNILAVLVNTVNHQIGACAYQRSASKLQLEMLTRRSRRVRGPEKNFIRVAIDGEIRNGLDSLKALDRNERLLRHCLEVLKDYAYLLEEGGGSIIGPGERETRLLQ